MQIDKNKLIIDPKADPIIQNILDTLDKVSIFIKKDGGDIAFKGFDKEKGIVYVSLLGACEGCGLVDSTISGGVEAILQQEVQGVNSCQLVDDNYNIIETPSYDWY